MLYLRSINRFILISLALLGLSVSSVNAAIIVSVTPDSTLNVGDFLTVDVEISGLGSGSAPSLGAPSLGAFDLDLSFDDSLFDAGAVTFGDGLNLGNPADSFQNVASFTGLLLILETSFNSTATLNGSQPDSFLLFSVEFLAVGAGTGLFSIDPSGDLIDAAPMPSLLDFSSTSAEVTVLSPSAVPVPATVWLFGTALIGLVGFGKRKSRIAA